MEILRRLNLAQQSRRFKIVASIVAAAVILGAFIVLLVVATRPGADTSIAERLQARAVAGHGIFDRGPVETVRTLVDATLLSMRSTPGIVGTAILTAGMLVGVLVAIWLGLGLSYLALLALGLLIGWPLATFEATRSLGQIVLGIVPLSVAFLVLMQLARLALAAPTPVFAVARNLLQEAVRMKISVVFIVLMIIMLAVIPTLLSPEQPLRYRVQQWLQYGTGLTFLVLALMTVFFATATVTFEQRDRVIWQTMTKPVRPWQFLAGKWVGVMTLNAVLLAVSSSGVFLITEYLRRQPAHGELYYRVPENQMIPITQDRDGLENEVLVARRSAYPYIAPVPREFFDQVVEERYAAAIGNNPELADTNPDVVKAQIRNEIAATLSEQQRSVPRGGIQDFEFHGLKEAVSGENPDALTLRFNVNAGTNDPTAQYRLQMAIGGVVYPVEAGLDVSQVLPIRPDAVDDEGILRISILNEPGNPFTVVFPPGGLELLYGSGGYESNFFRVVIVMWLKLCFIAAVAIACSTFVSFPVAILITAVVFFAAESASYLTESLEYFEIKDREGSLDILRWVSYHISQPVAWMLGTYARLRPTANLVDGRLVPWSGVLRAGAVLMIWSLVVMAAGLAVFRRRELATYSGR